MDEKDLYGETSLHYAVDKGHKEIAKLLIAEGADVNAKANNGETAIDTAIRVHEVVDRTKTADLLRKHGGKTSEELKAEGK